MRIWSQIRISWSAGTKLIVQFCLIHLLLCLLCGWMFSHVGYRLPIPLGMFLVSIFFYLRSSDIDFYPYLVTISVPKDTKAVVVLSELDNRYFETLSGRYKWMHDFVIFKKGEKDIIAESSTCRALARSVSVEVFLAAGEYVVHVRFSCLMEEG